MQNSIKASSRGATVINADQSSMQSVPNEVKYGKDFKVPELPPILQAQLFGGEDGGRSMFNQPTPTTWFTQAGGAGSTQYKIKKFIDDIYQKEMKYRYHK